MVCTFLLSSILSPLSPSLWETARYRLKYCLKGPLNPKQPTNPNRAISSSGTRRYKDIRRLRGYCTAVMQFPCCCRTVPAAFTGKSYGASAASAQRLSGDLMVNVRLSCICVFFTIRARPRRGPHAGIVRCYLQRLRAMGFRFFKLVINSLNKMVESTAPVSPYGPHLPPYGGRKLREKIESQNMVGWLLWV